MVRSCGDGSRRACEAAEFPKGLCAGDGAILSLTDALLDGAGVVEEVDS